MASMGRTWQERLWKWAHKDGRRLASVSASLQAVMLCVWASFASALPQGRAWAPVTRLSFPGVVNDGLPRLDVDETGSPTLIIEVQRDTTTTLDWNVFAWRDSAWIVSDATRIPGFDPPVVASTLGGRKHIAWVAPYLEGGYANVLMSEIAEGRLLPPDTAMFTIVQDTEHGAAASARRRWVVRSQQRFPISILFAVRTAYSDTVGIWHELPEQGVDEDHCTVAPLSDSSAMIVYAGESGLAWAVAEGAHWTRSGAIDSRPFVAAHPRLRVRPGGGLWLLWTDKLWVHVSKYEDGAWSRGDSLVGVHRDGETFWAAWCDQSLDDRERPVLAWGDLGVGYTYRDVGSVAFPTASGWAPGEEIPGSDGMFLTPYIARDQNGDVWAAWRVKREYFNRWTHTYVSATSSAPSIQGGGRNRAVAWLLSEPAPESWWAVLRARGSGDFEQVARLQAGSSAQMSWQDSSPAAGVMRYRVRRESVDSRYRWESEEGRWPPNAQRPLTLSTPSGLLGESLSLGGAVAGAIEIRIYDVQGRLSLRQQAKVTGAGDESLRLDLALAQYPLHSGVYFAQAKDASGRQTAPLKLVLLK